ncbi:MAG: hypothetical protein IIB42_03710 [Candidatus Marinimicrobia bacterium]|nr:hypothetical protein [Candidatus Neomarinimicrobiota bacterium]
MRDLVNIHQHKKALPVFGKLSFKIIRFDDDAFGDQVMKGCFQELLPAGVGCLAGQSIKDLREYESVALSGFRGYGMNLIQGIGAHSVFALHEEETAQG